MARNGNAEVTVSSPKPFETLTRRMADLANLDDGTDVDTSRMDRTLIAETEDEIWASGEIGGENSKTIAGVELEIDNFEIKFSRGVTTIKTPYVFEGKQMYMLVHGTRISASEVRADIAVGDEVVFNTSAPDVVNKLWRLREKGYLPVECFVDQIDLGGGQEVSKLRPVPKRAQRSQVA
jgi:hypothetical protein